MSGRAAVNRFASGRHAGLLVPLFSMPSSHSWGIGEITDLPAVAGWMAASGLDILQVLPIHELPPGESSPYSALTAAAIDPIYIGVHAVEDFRALGREPLAGGPFHRAVSGIRASPVLDYGRVRMVKMEALGAAFDRFHDEEWVPGRRRAQALGDYIGREQSWLDEYAVFRAIHADQDERPWPDWDPALRDRDPRTLAEFRGDRARQILFHQYLQWIAGCQWADARAAAAGVGLFGDLPFMVSGDSADVWAGREDFRLDASIGTPPDAFSETGQDWALPAYRWEAMAQNGFRRLDRRARRMADLYEGYRIDHLVGFYRTYIRPQDDSPPRFEPDEEAEQVALGERVLEIFRAPGAFLIAEDLGTVPDFVRASLARLRVPGYRVLRWEREWHEPEQPYRDPAQYPPVSVATTGTHDTETLAAWWESLPDEERVLVTAIPALAGRGLERRAAFDTEVRDLILEVLFASGSDLVILPVQDLFGWRDRINTPAVIDTRNWTYRLPWPADRLGDEPEALERVARVREWTAKYRRL